MDDVAPQLPVGETYLGDGLYVSFDGYQLWLRAPRDDGDHMVALDAATYEALTEYVARLKKAKV